MRCDDIQERFVELLYQERGTPPASAELLAHVDSCPACRSELKELKAVRQYLARWKDEAPLRPFALPVTSFARPERPRVWRVMRYAAAAAMVLLSFLALANADITWNDRGFAFRTRLSAWGGSPATAGEYYTKGEIREILIEVIRQSEAHMKEDNFQMMQSLKEAIDNEHHLDYRILASRLSRRQINN